jgi:signal transduction histidine kinase
LHQQTRDTIDQYKVHLQKAKAEHARSRAALESQLAASKKEASVYIQKLYETEQGEQRAQNDALEARRIAARIREESRAELLHLKGELKRSIEHTTRMTQRIAELDTVRLELEEQLQTLEQEKADLQFQLAVAATLQQDFAPTSGTAGPEALSAQMDGMGMEVVDSLACGVILCNPEGLITLVNASGAQLLGRDAEQYIGESAFDLWADAKWQSALHTATDRYAAGGPSTPQAQLEPYLIESLKRPIQAEVTPLRIAERHVGALIALHDAGRVDERIRARDEFLASLAQDLRTPMTSILGYTELLMNESVGKLEGIQRKFLQRVQANVERMGGMLNDLIGVTAIDSGKLVLELEPVDLVNVIETALRKAQFRLEEKELRTHLQLNTLPLILADADSMQQIVDNLLTNACKSSKSGSTIGIQAHVENDDAGKSYLHVAVADTGGGIAPEDQPRVFERFYRADNALIAGLGETGVGLAIVKALVEAHRGHVWNESEMGVGTTFHFTLPAESESREPGGNGRG